MARSKSSQSKHDQTVRKVAYNLNRKGYSVKADVRGFKQPSILGGYRPDVVARKGNQRKIIEVETPDSVNSARDQKQRQAFRRAASRSSKTTFKRIVTK